MGRSLNALQTKIKNLKKEARQIKALQYKDSITLTGPELQSLKSKKKYLDVISDDDVDTGTDNDDCGDVETQIYCETADENDDNGNSGNDDNGNENDDNGNSDNDDNNASDYVDNINGTDNDSENTEKEQEQEHENESETTSSNVVSRKKRMIENEDDKVTGNRRITNFFHPVTDLLPDEDVVPVSSLRSTTFDIKTAQEKIASARNARNYAINEKILEKKEMIKHVKENSMAQEQTRKQVLNASKKLVQLAETVAKKRNVFNYYYFIITTIIS